VLFGLRFHPCDGEEDRHASPHRGNYPIPLGNLFDKLMATRPALATL
jgi:hypothetical protein